MDAPSSPLSSPIRGPNVNAEAPRRTPIPLRRLKRRIIRIERGIRAYRPRFPEPPPKPDRADEVLDALARRHRPGTPISSFAIMAAGGVRKAHALAIRQWARSAGLWPYAEPLTGFVASRNRDPEGFYSRIDARTLAAWKRRQGGEP